MVLTPFALRRPVLFFVIRAALFCDLCQKVLDVHRLFRPQNVPLLKKPL